MKEIFELAGDLCRLKGANSRVIIYPTGLGFEVRCDWFADNESQHYAKQITLKEIDRIADIKLFTNSIIRAIQ